MKNKKWLLGVIAVLMAITFVFSACGGGSDGGSRGGSSGGTVNVGGVSVRIGPATPSTDFSYRLTEDGQGIVITRYSGDGGAVVIPAEIEGFPVVELGSRAFRGVDYGPGYNITSVVIPASVKLISEDTFLGCVNLTSVTILGTGVQIEPWAFSSTSNLSELIIQDGDNVLIPVDRASGGSSYVGSNFSFGKLPLATRARLVSMGFKE